MHNDKSRFLHDAGAACDSPAIRGADVAGAALAVVDELEMVR